MIEVRGVKLTVHDQRVLRKGWGRLHCVACLPTYALLAAFLGLALTVSALAGDVLPSFLVPGFIIATGLGWYVVSLLAWKLIHQDTARAPAGAVASDWALDEAGFALSDPIAGSRFAWAAIRDVREEKDRFVFLVTLMNNPVLPHRCLEPEQLTAMRALIETIRTSGRLGAGVD